MLARRAAILAVTAALLALAPASAHAAIVGGTLNAIGAHPLGCPASNGNFCTLIQTEVDGHAVQVPFDGRIKSFAVSVLPAALPPAGGISLDTYVSTPGGFDAVGGTSAFSVPSTPGVHRFTTNVPVRKGMLVGVSLVHGAGFGTICCLGAVPDANAGVQRWWTGALGALPADGFAHRKLLFTADVEPPLPDTQITGSTIGALQGKATFKFKAVGKAAGFNCALVRLPLGTPTFKSCTSPKSYANLLPGSYSFRVRAFNAAGPDPTPATKPFAIG
jgi:hypothetical protein